MGVSAILISEKSKEIINNQQPMDKSIIERVRVNLAERGVIIEQSEMMDKFLIQRGAEAATLAPGDLIILHTKVSASGFYEELIHYGQFRRGNIDISSKSDIIKNEIEAQERLIKYQKAYKITDYEIEVLKNNLGIYKAKLEMIMNGGI